MEIACKVCINVFSTTLELQALLIKTYHPETKTAEKPWPTKELREEIMGKQTLFNIWKKNTSEQAHTSFKHQRNLVIRHLKTAPKKSFANTFSKTYQQVKNNGVSSKKKLAKKESVPLKTNQSMVKEE